MKTESNTWDLDGQQSEKNCLKTSLYFYHETKIIRNSLQSHHKAKQIASAETRLRVSSKNNRWKQKTWIFATITFDISTKLQLRTTNVTSPIQKRQVDGSIRTGFSTRTDLVTPTRDGHYADTLKKHRRVGQPPNHQSATFRTFRCGWRTPGSFWS